jgi:hypothetical protein
VLEAVGNTGHFQKGELVINGVATSRYALPTVPDPAQPWFMQGPVSISVAGLGQFNYVFDWSVQSGLQPIAQCAY